MSLEGDGVKNFHPVLQQGDAILSQYRYDRSLIYPFPDCGITVEVVRKRNSISTIVISEYIPINRVEDTEGTIEPIEFVINRKRITARQGEVSKIVAPLRPPYHNAELKSDIYQFDDIHWPGNPKGTTMERGVLEHNYDRIFKPAGLRIWIPLTRMFFHVEYDEVLSPGDVEPFSVIAIPTGANLYVSPRYGDARFIMLLGLVTLPEQYAVLVGQPSK